MDKSFSIAVDPIANETGRYLPREIIAVILCYANTAKSITPIPLLDNLKAYPIYPGYGSFNDAELKKER